MADTSIIEVRDLSHSYLSETPLQVHALKGVSLTVNRDEIVGIIGPTGSGKSTLLSHLNGLIRPQSGDVRVFGLSLTDNSVDVKSMRRRIGMLFQNPEQQLFERFVGDDVAFGPKNYHVEGEELRRAVRDAMELVGLPFSYKDRLTSDLSLGEKRRVALAGVFALNPQVLVLDEPTASLDPHGRELVLDLLKGWQQMRNRSIVIVSHNMEDIVELANRTYLLSEGRIVYGGKTSELFSNPDLLMSHGLALTAPLQVIYSLSEQGIHLNGGSMTALDVAEEIGGMLHGAA